MTAATPAQPAHVSPHLECAVCASGVTTPHGAGGTGGTPGQALANLAAQWRHTGETHAEIASQAMLDGFPEVAAVDRARADVWHRCSSWLTNAIAAQEPHAAPGESSPGGLKHAVTSNRLGHALAALREIRDGEGADSGDLVERACNALADDAAIRSNVMLTEEPKPAPELADAMRESRVRAEVITEILDAFGPSGSGHTARVGQVQIAKWRTRAGLTPACDKCGNPVTEGTRCDGCRQLPADLEDK